jgi:hypothetical protein
MKKFVLKKDGIDRNINYIYPDLNPEKIPSQYVLDGNQNFFSAFLSDDTSFKGMIPEYIGDNPPKKVHTICDMHGWLNEKPSGLMYPVSKRFKELLEKFNIPDSKFYEGSVIWNEEEYPYFIWHILVKKLSLVDFKESLFCDTDYFSKEPTGREYFKVNDFSELYPLRREKNWDMWGFYKAKMYPEFREVDVCEIDHYGTLISERLKKAIDEALLTNISVIPCPVVFEISGDI